jgi:hypothetical protein
LSFDMLMFCPCGVFDADGESDTEDEPGSDGGLAEAAHGVAAIPTPMPSATANPPTRPIYLAYPITDSLPLRLTSEIYSSVKDVTANLQQVAARDRMRALEAGEDSGAVRSVRRRGVRPQQGREVGHVGRIRGCLLPRAGRGLGRPCIRCSK